MLSTVYNKLIFFLVLRLFNYFSLANKQETEMDEDIFILCLDEIIKSEKKIETLAILESCFVIVS